MEKILVTYATKYGATKEIAEKIGEVLRQAGLQTDVISVDQARDLTPYKAVILGSAVYIGKWRKEAVEFLKKNAQALAERPVWLFSSGPTGEGDPVELVKGWHIPGELQPLVEQIKPRDIAVFHGSLDNERMNMVEKWMIKNVKAPVGDFRDWDAITAWATSIVEVLC
jgi:menaquinone-dependent protoporphyrinogen oxidase